MPPSWNTFQHAHSSTSSAAPHGSSIVRYQAASGRAGHASFALRRISQASSAIMAHVGR